MCDGNSEDGHDRVADELLHGAAVAFERLAQRLVVPVHDAAMHLGIEPLGERRRVHDVAEDHGDGLAGGHGPIVRPRGLVSTLFARMFDTLGDKLNAALGPLRGRGKLDEEVISRAMREIRLALLEADVNFKVVKEFVAKVQGARPRPGRPSAASRPASRS